MAVSAAMPERCAAFLATVDAAPAGDGKWKARCPAHDDRSPSLGIGLDDKGLWVKCHAGCEFRAILRAVGFGPADLFFERPKRERAQWEPPVKRNVVATYDYRDENGNLLYQSVRYEPKGFSQRTPCAGRGQCKSPGCRGQRDGWHWMLANVRRVLYRLPEIVAAPGRAVLVVEGEKDADALAALGFLAACNVGGAGKWADDYSRALAGREVAVVPDLDPPGLRHGDSVVGSLVRHGASRVRLVLLPDCGGRVKDVSDWLALVPAAERRAELERLVKASRGR